MIEDASEALEANDKKHLGTLYIGVLFLMVTK